MNDVTISSMKNRITSLTVTNVRFAWDTKKIETNITIINDTINKTILSIFKPPLHFFIYTLYNNFAR